MNISPTSAASSSDIYSNSELPEHETRAQNTLSLPPGKERLHPALEVQDTDLRYLTHSQPSVIHSSQGLHMVVHGASHPQSNPSTHIVAMANGDPQRDHKRKREDDEASIREKPSVVRQGSIPHPGRTISHEPRKYNSNEDSGIISTDWSSKKRSKPNEEFQRPISQTGNPFQSPVLPAELWQHIFCFVPPLFLGRLLHVNHAFHAYLTSEKANEQDSKPVPHSIVQPLNPQAIWCASRRRFCPGLPKPIRGTSELDMWRLLRGRNCQICGETKASSLTLDPDNPWEAGPGEKGVRVIWPFAVRCCGKCIQEGSEKEVNLHFSSDCPSFLLPALPFAFISSSNNYITNTVLRTTAPPPQLQLTKHYYKPHIQEIKQRLEGARELGSASADEWIKGLDGEGKDRLGEAVRWEQWEAKGGLKKVNLRSLRATTIPGHTSTGPKVSNAKNGTHSDRSTPQVVSLPSRLSGDSGSPPSSSPNHLPHFPQNTSTSLQPPWVSAVSYPENPQHRNPNSFPPPRPERNIRDVNEAKAARRAEIERRCAALDPPLLPNVLGHMESFLAAIQISQPLGEQAWQVLKPRLLAQRAYAERRERDRVEQSQLLQAEYKQRRQQEAQLKETKESLDREWASIQTPIRNQISEFADEIIDTKWARGKSVTKDNSPKFAADVLLYVRKRFYDEVACENENIKSIGENVKTDNPDSAPNRILILENMKWLFDTKVKPLTEHFQKELFLCNGCEGNFKFYGLDSVVQHYAAKHTHDLSLGTQVVHWRAEWPEHPPFHPNPSTAKAAYYKIPTPQTSSLQALSMRDSPLPINPEGYGQLKNAVVHPAQQPHNTSQYSPRAYPEPYAQIFLPDRNYSPPATQNFLLPAPGPPGHAHDFSKNANSGQIYLAPQRSTCNTMYINNGFQPSHSGTIPQAEHSALSGYVPTDAYTQDQKTLGWHGLDTFPRTHGGNSVAQHQQNPQKRPSNFQQSYVDQSRDVTGQNTELYQHQIDEMVKHARDFWFATSGIKDIPQSVRIFVVIQHMVASYKKVYSSEPSLGMFIDGLDHNSLMRPVRSLNGLACKVCVTNGSGANGEPNPFAPLPTGDRRLYTLPHLLNHFKTAHLEEPLQPFAIPLDGIEIPRIDWKVDMIELPEKSLIADLTEKPGLDDAKLELIAQVFPGVFPSPLPRVGAPSNAGPVPVYTGGFELGTRQLSKILPETFPDSPPRGEGRNEINRSYSSFRELSQPARSSEPPGEDEYDPHRPALPSGVGSVHPRKSARTPSTDNEQPSTLHIRHRDFRYVPSDAIDRPRSTYNGPPIRRVAEDYHTVQFYEPNSKTRSRVSPLRRIEALPEDHFNHEQGGPREQKTLEKPNGHSVIVDSSVPHTRISEDRELRDSSASLKPRQQSLSVNDGASAADQFLDKLASSSDLNSGQNLVSLDREESRSTVRREDLSQDRYRKQQVDATSESQGWRVDVASGQRPEIDPPAVSMRKDPSTGRSYEELSSPHGRHIDHQYDENYRSSSQTQRPLGENRVERRSPETYTAYEAPHPTIIQDRYESRGGLIEGSHMRDGSFHMAPTPRYRSGSRSPRPIPLGTTYYRARSPTDDHRHESVYHIRSPPLRKERIISYDYPVQDRYEYVDDRKITHNQLRPRIEYVLRESAPIEPGRFVIAQPTEMRPQPDYVRFDRGYPAEPIYERHGQIYHADTGSYHPQQGHGAPTFSQGYRY